VLNPEWIAGGRELRLKHSTCHRSLDAAGFLIEIVDLDGSGQGLSESELSRFVARFPVRSHNLIG
jgi:hypothetical protein